MATKAAPVPRPTLAAQRELVNILYYGDPGGGKTTSLAALARLGRVIHIDAESGLKARPLTRLGIPVDNIEPFTDISFEAMEGLFWQVKAELEADPNAYVGIVWDSVTETQKKLMEAIVAQAKIKANKRGMERDEFFVDRAEWGVNTEQMRRLIRKFRDLPIHVGFSCLSRRDQDDDGTVTYGPALTPALQGDLMGYVDLVCYTKVEMVNGVEERQGVFRPVGKYQAKDRFGALPRTLVDPTFDRVIAYVNEELTPETDPIQVAAKQRRAQKE